MGRHGKPQGTFAERHVVLSSETCGLQAEGPSLKTVKLEEPGVLGEQLEGSATIKVSVWWLPPPAVASGAVLWAE